MSWASEVVECYGGNLDVTCPSGTGIARDFIMIAANEVFGTRSNKFIVRALHLTRTHHVLIIGYRVGYLLVFIELNYDSLWVLAFQ